MTILSPREAGRVAIRKNVILAVFAVEANYVLERVLPILTRQFVKRHVGRFQEVWGLVGLRFDGLAS